MWKNLWHRKILNNVNVTYRIKGLNQDRLIESLKKREITLFNVKKINNKLMYISVNLNQSKNFFAITKELCYNIKKVRLYGKGLFVYQLVKNAGLIIGALAFVLICVISNDYIFSINFSGSGSVCQSEVREDLACNGIAEGARFSSFSIERLEDGILASNPRLTFASAVKKGNRLEVYLVLKNQKIETLGKNVSQLNSNVAGIVRAIKVYRGRAMVNVGDFVQEGSLLVDGKVEVKDQVVFVGVLAYVEVGVKDTIVYTSQKANEQELAKLFALEKFNEEEILDTYVSVKEVIIEQKIFYEYAVTIEYLRAMYAG